MAHGSEQEVQQYFSECIQFLYKYDWIYNFQLTHFFTDRVWENIPSEWVNILMNLTTQELNQIPFGYYKKSWPESLKQFLQLALSLTIPRCPLEDDSPFSIDDKLISGMSPKKRHEVSHLAKLVDRVCKENDCKSVVDVGSGLGYLSLVLSHQLGYQVLGIECQEARCRGAEVRANKCYEEKANNFKSRPFSLKDDATTKKEFRKVLCEQFGKRHQNAEPCEGNPHANKNPNNEVITSHLSSVTSHKASNTFKMSTTCDDTLECLHCKERINSSNSQSYTQLCNVNSSMEKYESTEHERTLEKICLIGLHCCGNLTPTMLKLFTELEELKAIIVIGCCYHRMTATEEGSFQQFPISNTLKQVLQDWSKDGIAWKITTYGLRLATQETGSRWKSQDTTAHNYHKNNVTFRGILDLVLQKEKIKMAKNWRKLVTKEHCTDIDMYINAVLSRVKLDDGVDKDALKDKILATHSDHREVLNLVEPFTCLQVVLQGVLESLILKDQEQYILEHGLKAELLPILDDSISPRNVAILAYK